MAPVVSYLRWRMGNRELQESLRAGLATVLPEAPPTEEDWGGREGDLDAQWAYKVFYGKDAAQTHPLFAANVIERAEEISFMPRAAFQYYFVCFADYVAGSEVLVQDDASSAASCFLRLLESALRTHRGWVMPLLPQLLPVAAYVAANQRLFDADRDIFGDFGELLAKIEALSS